MGTSVEIVRNGLFDMQEVQETLSFTTPQEAQAFKNGYNKGVEASHPSDSEFTYARIEESPPVARKSRAQLVREMSRIDEALGGLTVPHTHNSEE